MCRAVSLLRLRCSGPGRGSTTRSAAEKRDALAAIEMGHVVKVVLWFRTRFWELVQDGRFRDTSFFRCVGQPFAAFWTHYPLRSTAVVAWVGGPKAIALQVEEILQAMELPSIDPEVRRYFQRPLYRCEMLGGGGVQRRPVQELVDQPRQPLRLPVDHRQGLAQPIRLSLPAPAEAAQQHLCAVQHSPILPVHSHPLRTKGGPAATPILPARSAGVRPTRARARPGSSRRSSRSARAHRPLRQPPPLP